MRARDIDPIAKLIAIEKRRELERRYEAARIKRLAKNLPITGEWHARWYFYIEDTVDKAVLDFLAPQDKSA